MTTRNEHNYFPDKIKQTNNVMFLTQFFQFVLIDI